MSHASVITPILLGLMSMLENPRTPQRKESFRLRGRHKEEHPWDHIHLSKAERQGKTYAQMQALRAEKWRSRLSVGE